jgi:hypothetical protein
MRIIEYRRVFAKWNSDVQVESSSWWKWSICLAKFIYSSLCRRGSLILDISLSGRQISFRTKNNKTIEIQSGNFNIRRMSRCDLPLKLVKAIKCPCWKEGILLKNCLRSHTIFYRMNEINSARRYGKDDQQNLLSRNPSTHDKDSIVSTIPQRVRWRTLTVCACKPFSNPG